MRSGPICLSLASVLGVSLVLSASAARPKAPAAKPRTDAEKATAPAALDYTREIAPLTRKYCVTCHGANNAIGGINFEAFKDEASVSKSRAVWQKTLENVKAGHMPPKSSPQPTPAQRAILTGWIEAKLNKLDCGLKDPGRVTMRRLNRAEYENTVRDLLGVEFKASDIFPSDDVGYGFDNIGDVLTMSPLLMEKYLSAAEKITKEAIATPDPPTRRFEAERMPQETQGDGVLQSYLRNLVSNGEVRTELKLPLEGEYLIRARAYGQQAGDEPAKMVFRLDGKDLATVEVKAVEQKPEVYEQKVRIPAGTHRVAVAFTNDFYDPKNPDRSKRDRNLLVDYLDVVGPLGGKLEQVPDSHKRIFVVQPSATVNKDEARKKILGAFARRAYRRPATAAEVERLVQVARLADKEGESFERSIQLGVQAALVSPYFLFRVELDPNPMDPKAKRVLNDWELASRLSYFLWSSMPDDELLGLAEKGQLRKPEVLEAQALRMLKSPRADALVDNFAMQWLTLRNLANVSPDPKQFPGWNNELRADMLQETRLFCQSIFREDRSLLDFVDGKFTFLNERLAKHYGIPGVTGNEFRRVVLPGDQRMGVLTQGSILTVTSNPTRTSPVKRGKWVLEQLLGTPPPPAPPNVPELKEEGQMLTGTLRQRMEQHRKDPGCASCHARLDPLGFGLENFDAVGAWRTQEGQFAVDSSGELPGGKKFEGPAQLLAILKGQKEQISKSFTDKMMTYALGRGLEYYDRCVVETIAANVGKKGHRFSAVVTEIVKSEPFRMRRGDDGGE